MSDSEIIWKFLIREYNNDHPAIYLYVCGGNRSIYTALNKILPTVLKIFSPAMSVSLINTTVKGYLEHKKKQYKNGEITVKSLY